MSGLFAKVGEQRLPRVGEIFSQPFGSLVRIPDRFIPTSMAVGMAVRLDRTVERHPLDFRPTHDHVVGPACRNGLFAGAVIRAIGQR